MGNWLCTSGKVEPLDTDPSTVGILFVGFDEAALLKYGEQKWEKVKLPKVNRPHLRQPGLAVIGDSLYVFGGYDDAGPTSAMFQLDETTKWQKLAPITQPRKDIALSSVVLEGQIWVLGGRNSNDKLMKSVERYDPASDSWTQMPNMRYSRARASATILNGRIYICGGTDETNSLEYFEPSAGVWTKLTTLPAAFFDCGIVAHGAHLIIFGGYTLVESRDHMGAFPAYLRNRKVWQLDTERQDWKKLEPTQFGSFYAKAHAIDENIVHVDLDLSRLPCEHFIENVWEEIVDSGMSIHGASSVVVSEKLYSSLVKLAINGE